METLALLGTTGLGYYLNRKPKIKVKYNRKKVLPNSKPSSANIYTQNRVKKMRTDVQHLSDKSHQQANEFPEKSNIVYFKDFSTIVPSSFFGTKSATSLTGKNKLTIINNDKI